MQTVDINGELYQPILAALNVDVDPTGQLMMKYPDKTAAATVSKRNLLLPTPEILRSLPENALVFHPLSENVARGDSAIQNYLKSLVTFRVTFALTYLVQQLYSVASDSKLHGKLTGDQLAILSILPDADAKGLANLNRVLESIDMNKVRMYNIYNRRNGSIAGAQYNRVAVATFPLLDELLEPTDTLWGHRDVRKRDLKDYKALVDYILPEWNVKDQYSAASDSMEAPSFHALMSAFVKVMEPLNRVGKVYGSLFKDRADDGTVVDMAPYVMADLSFQHRLSNLSKYRNIIPVMVGNDGEALAGAQEEQQVVQNPRSVAPAFMNQNPGDSIKAPEPVVQQQNAPTIQPNFNGTYNPHNVQQGQSVQQQNGGNLGFGGYSSGNPQQGYGYNNGYVQQQNPQGQQQQQQGYNAPSGVAGFGSYSSQGAGFNNTQQTGYVNGWGNGQMTQQGFQTQQGQNNPPSPFDTWNANAAQGQQQQLVIQQSNPYTMPTPPAQAGFVQQGFQQQGFGGQQQQIQIPQGCQVVVTPQGQQILVNQFGQQVAWPQQQQQQQGYGQQGFVQQGFGGGNGVQGFGGQQQQQGFGNPQGQQIGFGNPYGAPQQQQQVGFKVRAN